MLSNLVKGQSTMEGCWEEFEAVIRFVFHPKLCSWLVKGKEQPRPSYTFLVLGVLSRVS